MILLEVKHLVGGLLGEELDRELLVRHGDLRLAPHISPHRGVSSGADALLVLLEYRSDLVSSFNVNLAGLDYLLQDLGVLFGQ